MARFFVFLVPVPFSSSANQVERISDYFGDALSFPLRSILVERMPSCVYVNVLCDRSLTKVRFTSPINLITACLERGGDLGDSSHPAAEDDPRKTFCNHQWAAMYMVLLDKSYKIIETVSPIKLSLFSNRGCRGWADIHLTFKILK